MPFRRGGFSRRRSMYPRAVINSIKNSVGNQGGMTTTETAVEIAKAVDTPVSATGPTEVSQGSIIKAIYCILDVCGLAGTGVLQRTGCYIIKNPGANLTIPSVFSVGTSNEKKFIFKEWQFMTMLVTEGINPNHWEGWIKIPKRYQRMGTDDVLQLVHEVSGATGHITTKFIYKWFR